MSIVLFAALALAFAGSPEGALRQRAKDALQALDYEAAWALSKQACAEEPSDPEAHALGATAALKLKRYREADVEASQAISLGLDKPFLHQIRSEALHLEGRDAEALAEAERALALNPDSAESRFRRAAALLGMDRRAEGLEDLRRASELDPRFLSFYDGARAQRPAPARSRLPWALAALGGALLMGLFLFGRRKRGVWRVRYVPELCVPAACDEPRSGAVIGGRYILGRALDRGPAEQVFEGRDLEDVARVIRRYPLSLEPRRRFQLARARAACALSHRGLCALEAAFEEGAWGFAVHVPYEGQTLAALLERAAGRRLACETVLLGARPLCEGLDAAHAAGLTHGRLSTRQILAHEGAWRLVGIGLPGPTSSEASAPEGGAESREADLYALGLCLYEALAGERPFSGADAELAKREGRCGGLDGRLGLPAGLDSFFARALQPEPARRFHSAGEALLALRSVVSPAVH